MSHFDAAECVFEIFVDFVGYTITMNKTNLKIQHETYQHIVIYPFIPYGYVHLGLKGYSQCKINNHVICLIPLLWICALLYVLREFTILSAFNVTGSCWYTTWLPL